jgi:hypothetical protein
VTGFEVVAAVLAIFFVAGALIGVLLSVALASRPAKSIQFRYKGSEIGLNPDDPRDAEKIVQRWLKDRDNLDEGVE